ncbi:MAG: hypothetical protein H0X26_08605 [Alphaproteobacteria bacterium]|nr:hypothetical protein [Alphaproteobacteria bacterium]
MEYIKVLYHPFLKNGIWAFLKVISPFQLPFQKISKKVSGFVVRAKKSAWFQNTLLIFCLSTVPMGAVFIKDYVNDQIEWSKAQRAVETSLISSTDRYAQFLDGLKNKILLEKLYENDQGLYQLLADVNVLKAYAAPPLQSMRGLQWISPHLKALGLYGDVHNFNPKLFLNFLRILDQSPNNIQIIKTNEETFFGMGIAEGKEIKGYLIIPFPLEKIMDSLNFLKFSTFQFSSHINLPFLGVPLEALTKTPFSYVQIDRKIGWINYGLKNATAYSVFLLFALIILLFKRKSDAKKEADVLQLQKKTQCLGHNLQAQHKAANLIIDRLHEVNGSIEEISNILLQTHSPSSVLSEQDRINFIRKIYDTSSALEKKIIQNSTQESIDLKQIITGCLQFYGSKLDEAQIYVEHAYDIFQSSFISDRDAFTQLMFNLFHRALERTPEKGKISITATKPETEKDGFFILTIEDSGYTFSSEEIKKFKQPNKPIFDDYFDLEWESILELARNINCRISVKKVSLIGNRIVLTIREHKTVDQEALYEKYAAENNIIRLFPPS